MNLEEQKKIFSGACAATDIDMPRKTHITDWWHAIMLLAKRYPDKIHICPWCFNSIYFDRNEDYKNYETPTDETERAYWNIHSRKYCCKCKHTATGWNLIDYRKALCKAIKEYFDKTPEDKWDFDEFIKRLKDNPIVWFEYSSFGIGELRGEF